jgi:hypothetical protein
MLQGLIIAITCNSEGRIKLPLMGVFIYLAPFFARHHTWDLGPHYKKVVFSDEMLSRPW